MAIEDKIIDAADAVARTVLPKSLEKEFGIKQKDILNFPVGEGLTEEEKEKAEKIVSGETGQKKSLATLSKVQPEKVAEIKGEVLSEFDPRLLKEEIRQLVLDDINSGVLDSDAIKGDVKNFIKQKINTQILQKLIPQERRTIRGLAKNFKEDATQLVDGIGALLGMGIKAVLNPIDSIKAQTNFTAKMITSPEYRNTVKTTYVDPIVEEYKEYRHPVQKIYEDPFFFMLDATAIASLAGKGIQVGGQSAKIATARQSAIAKQISVAREAVQNATTKADKIKAANTLKNAKNLEKGANKSHVFRTAEGVEKVGERLMAGSRLFSIKNLSLATKSILRTLPNGDEIVRTMELSAATRKLLSKEQIAFLNARNNMLNEVNKRVDALSSQEIKILPVVAEGFAQAPKGASQPFYEALGMVRALADDQARFGIKSGKLTPEIIERRRFQPLAAWLEKENKFVPEELASAKQALKDVDPSNATKVASAEKKLQKARGEFGFENLSGEELQGYIATIKKFFPEADPIYMRHFFSDDPKKFTSFILNTKPVRTFKPGFLKKSYNKEGYIGSETNVTNSQLKEILTRQASENIKWQNNARLINELKNHPLVKPFRKGDDLLPNHEIFAPDGFLRFYRGTIDITRELKKRTKNLSDTDNIWEAFGDAVDSVFPKIEKQYVGVAGEKLFQAPKAMANELRKITRASNPYVKLFYDKPIDVFRAAALALMPRWQFNNMIGNMVFSIVKGDVFNPKAFYIYTQARKKPGLLPNELFGGVHQVERTSSGKLGSAANLPLVRSTVAMHDNLLNTKVIGTIVGNVEKAVNMAIVKPILTVVDKSFKTNQYVDDMFKGVSFINKTLKNERKNFITRMTATLDDSLKALEKTGASKKLSEQMVDDIHKWYYYGLNLTDFERRVVRRVMPFYSWMRWASLYAYRITTETPVRANILANMSRDFYMFTGQEELPPFLRGSVPVGTDEDGTVYYLKTTGLNPFSHINDLLAGEGLIGSVMTTALRSAAPPIKTAAEQSLGRDVFLDRPFTKEDIIKLSNGSLHKFDPETGEVKEIEGKIRPGLMENMLRNYIPHYLLMETVLTGGQKRYTAEGLDEMLKDLFKDEAERKAIIKDVITRQGTEEPKWGFELLKSLGINIKEVTPESRRFRQEQKEAATSALLNKLAPILNKSEFKNKIRTRIMEEISKGTSKEEIATKLRGWLTEAITDIKVLLPQEETKAPAQ